MKAPLVECLRRLVARNVGTKHRAAQPDAIFDLGTSTGSNVATHKDDYLADAVAAERDADRH
jgi:hypothetical protein